jgi:hypothetical protein
LFGTDQVLLVGAHAPPLRIVRPVAAKTKRAAEGFKAMAEKPSLLKWSMKGWTAADDDRPRVLFFTGMDTREKGNELGRTATAILSCAFHLNLLVQKLVISQFSVWEKRKLGLKAKAK